ncbi:S9 family peptidase [Kushneria phosphatilytica]|uniref:S9 family peptidase n=1 Tax=Kushneria phosphatilytica TaxID=657387 RepID=A0A5C0ZZJ5_9GAMM|nr:S9 family peptidase [Kushneria phosphatilytica]QEL11992.1 S9 family peptidase [Kushneria phosphatilytica]
MRRMFTPVTAMCAGTADGGGAATSHNEVPLIERERLFGNPHRAQGRLSPDGRWLAWIAPLEGVLNLWVAPIDHPDQGRAMTAEQVRPIRSYFWSPDSQALLYVNDTGGDENFRLFGVNIDSGETRTLTPFKETRVQIIGISRLVRDRLLVGINNRDPRWHDVYSLDLASGELTLVLENEGYAGFIADEHLELRLAAQPREDGGETYFRITANGIEDEPFATIGFEDSANTGPIGFTRDGNTVYWIDSRERDTAALMAQDWHSGELRLIGHSPRADVTGILLDPVSDEVQAWAIDYLRTEWTALDDTIAADLAFLEGELKGDISVTSRTDDDRRWTVVNDPVTAPAETWLYDRDTRTLTSLYISRPELSGEQLAGMTPLEITARDGKTLVSYLTLPEGSDADGFRRPTSPLPMVLLVHGGPWARDSYGSNAYHQWLANRGYAVLSVNYRGSTGFGKRFTGAGDGEWAGAMHNDLLDAVAWAVEAGIADAERVAIMGGSYGGYAALVGLTFTPEQFACGVDIVGPSNLETLLSTIPPYWEAGKRQMYRRMADPETEEGAAWLKERSPLTHAGQISQPLLIGQGANDPRVKQAESDQIVDAMKANGIPVTYVLFPDEGHGFARPVNNIAFNAVTEAFLAETLGGRFEPIGEALKTSSIQVPHGVEYTPGLDEALNG